jgi:hypothetical protein
MRFFFDRGKLHAIHRRVIYEKLSKTLINFPTTRCAHNNNTNETRTILTWTQTQIKFIWTQ